MKQNPQPPLMYDLHYTRLRILQEYFYALDGFITAETARAQARVEDLCHREPTSDRFNLAAAEMEFVSTVHPRHLRYSFILQAVATMEDSLRSSCRHCTVSPLKPPSVSANVSELAAHIAAMGFLQSHAKEWTRPNDLVMIRNVIAHCGGLLCLAKGTPQTRLREVAKQEQGLHVDPQTTQMSLTTSFCYRSLIWIDALLDAIQSAARRGIWMRDSAHSASAPEVRSAPSGSTRC
jgi:hypothetical protein